MVIDSHQHFWNYDPDTHSWIDDSMAVIRADYLPEELEAVLNANGVDGCIAVQAEHEVSETKKLLEYADYHTFIKGVVGWVDLQSSSVTEDLAILTQNTALKGIRHIVQGEEDDQFLLRRAFMDGIALLKTYDLCYDILIYPHQLDQTIEFVRRFPEQPFVVDHLAKPEIKAGKMKEWANLMSRLAASENVACKISGMVTEADFKHWTPESIKPYMEHVLDAFGTDRLLYGSDWPVCLVAASYGQVKRLVTDFIKELTRSEQEAIMGGNAIKWYKL
jgi:L-fuconolactonase